MQAACSDIFGLFVDSSREAGDGFNCVVGDVELYAFGFEQRDVLLDERILGLGEDADEVFFLERLQLDTNGQAALQLGNQVGRLGDVEGAGGDEKNVVGANHAVAGVDSSAFDDRQDISLHALAADVGPVTGFATGDLVDFVDEDDAHLFG